MYLKLLIWVLVNYQYLRNTTSVNEQIRFSKIYDYQLDILKAIEFNETDDTICDDIPCITRYTRSNGTWACLDGADNLECPETFSTIAHVLQIIFFRTLRSFT